MLAYASRPYVGGAIIAGVIAMLWGGVLFPQIPSSSDPLLATLSSEFVNMMAGQKELSISSRGELKRDRDTFFWSLFTDKFGSNPNTPYMWNALPAFGFLLPSPIWNLRKHDAVVLLSRLPPKVEYFSLTTFALWMPKRGLPFSSLGDSVNNLNIKHTSNGLFTHVVTSNILTFDLIRATLVASGLPENAINHAAVPSDLGLFDDMTHFETVLRLFRFDNQTDGDAYIKAHHPVFYIKASHGVDETFPTRPYKDRAHADNVNETPLLADFVTHGADTLAKVGAIIHRDLRDLKAVPFAPLMIQGLECLQSRNSECLGDCPDAAYFGPHISNESDSIEMLSLPSNNEFHLVTLVNHRLLNSSSYGSIALLTSGKSSAVSKTKMSIRATSLGVTSFDFPSLAQHQQKFITWVFTRNPAHCSWLSSEAGAVDGCSVVEDSHVSRNKFLTYCERVYLNPVTGTGPDWADLLPARMFHVRLNHAQSMPDENEAALFSRVRLPPSVPVPTFNDTEPFRFLHIIKTGGESLEGHLVKQHTPKLDFSTCRQTALTAGGQSQGTTSPPSRAPPGCLASGAFVSSALCGLNCECCAADVRLPSGAGFHGTLLRSPRAHVLSQFSHCHAAHHGSWARATADVPLFFAEAVLQGTEYACGSSCTGNNPNWKEALYERLMEANSTAEAARAVRVISLHNTQAHALTCSKKKGSLGHHFRVLDEGVDLLAPPIADAMAAMQRFEWIGLTDLFEPSLCLLHYQANGTLPSACACDSPLRLDGSHRKLGHWVETRSEKRDPSTLPAEMLALIDAHTTVDSQLFAAALRLLLGRLRHVEEVTGKAILRCIDWRALQRATSYVPGLWHGPEALMVE